MEIKRWVLVLTVSLLLVGCGNRVVPKNTGVDLKPKQTEGDWSYGEKGDSWWLVKQGNEKNMVSGKGLSKCSQIRELPIGVFEGKFDVCEMLGGDKFNRKTRVINLDMSAQVEKPVTKEGAERLVRALSEVKTEIGRLKAAGKEFGFRLDQPKGDESVWGVYFYERYNGEANRIGYYYVRKATGEVLILD
jgi:hypothetical protein